MGQASRIWLGRASKWLLPLALAAAVSLAALTIIRADDGHRHHSRPGKIQAGVADLAELVGTDTDGLKSALADGQTLADIAEANDVEPQTVIDALTTKANERIDAAVESGKLSEADAEAKRTEAAERITERVNSGASLDKADSGRAGKHNRQGRLGRLAKQAMSAKLTELAELVGTDADGLKSALADGQTLAEIAEANDVEPQTVIDALTTKANERIDAAVESGKLSEEDAEAKRTEAAERITDRVNNGASKHSRDGECEKYDQGGGDWR